MLRIVDYTKRISELKDKARQALATSDTGIQIREGRSDGIRLVFAGQYSAGKSSILKMLTGREDIAIDAGITTQETHSYNWDGIEIVDTPGIHTQLRPDHDQISYEAIASADMLVFVITNELFDSYIADHFRKLAIDKDKDFFGIKYSSYADGKRLGRNRLRIVSEESGIHDPCICRKIAHAGA